MSLNATEVKINNQQFETQQPISITERRDEELDTGYLELYSVIREPFKIYSYVEITKTDPKNVNLAPLKYYFYIQNDDVELISKTGTLTYKHSITLIELTKIWDAVQLPSIAFTQPIDDSSLNYPNVKSIIDRLFKIAYTSLEGTILQVEYEEETSELLDNTIIKDSLILNDPTLYEALFRIGKTFNAIPRFVKKSADDLPILRFEKINEINNIIDLSKYDNEVLGVSIQDTASSLQTIALNSSSEGNIKSQLTIQREVSIQSTTVEIIESNMVVKLDFGINRIKQILCFAYDDQGNEVDFGDITRYILEKSQRDLLPVSGFSSGTTDLYQMNTAYFVFGSNTIDGWGDKYDRVFPSSNYRVWREVLTSAGISLTNVNFNNLTFTVYYESLVDRRLMRVAKNEIDRNNKNISINTNQSEDIVSIRRLGTRMNSLVERNGNLSFSRINPIVESLTKLFNINDLDKNTNGIISVRKLLLYEKYINATYELHQNYQKLTENIDISGNIRFWNNPDKSKAFYSYRYYEDFVEWNFVGFNSQNSSLTDLGVQYYFKTFQEDFAPPATETPLESHLIITSSAFPEGILKSLEIRGYGTTLDFMFKMDDTILAGKQVKINPGTANENTGIRYTAANGFLNKITIDIGVGGTFYDVNTLERSNRLPQVFLSDVDEDFSIIKMGDIQQIFEDLPIDDIITTPAPLFNRFTEQIIKEKFANKLFTEFKVTRSVITGSYAEDDPTNIFELKVEIDEGNGQGYQFIETGVNLPLNTEVTIPINKVLVSIRYTIITSFEQLDSPKTSFLYDTTATVSENYGGGGLEILKDSGERLAMSYFLHNVALNDHPNNEIGEIIIGEEAITNNFLIGGIRPLDVKVWIGGGAYNKFDKKAHGVVDPTQFTVIDTAEQSVKLYQPVTQEFAVTNKDGDIIYAVNPFDKTQPNDYKIFFNFTHNRTNVNNI
jgi:hypothetical protein